MNITELTEEVVAPRRPISGAWSPRKAKMQFPPRSKSGEGDPVYRQYHYTPESGERQLGVFLRQDFATNPNPPVMIIAGGLGFGGPVAANGWRRYLKNWNPIIVDTRGSGISTPVADTGGFDTNAIIQELIELQLFFGLREVGKIGYSFAGTLALLMAAELNKVGMQTPFVGALSPTYCQGDIEWCFDFDRIASKMTPEQRQRAGQIWNDLIAPLEERNIEVSPQAILDTYSGLFRCGDPAIFMDAFIRMRAWEYLPYGFLPEDYSAETVRRDMERGLQDGKSLDDFLIALMNNEANIYEFFINSEDRSAYQGLPESEIDQRRAELRQAITLARNIQNEVGWTEGWRMNAGFDQAQGIGGLLSPLEESGENIFVTLNSGDPLLPSDQLAQWRQALPKARMNIFDVAAHGTDSEEVRASLFDWIEQQRVTLCGGEAQEQRRRAVDHERSWQLDMKGAVQLSGGDMARAIAIMLTSERGDPDALAAQAERIAPVSLDDLPQYLNENFALCPNSVGLETRRLAPMIQSRLRLR